MMTFLKADLFRIRKERLSLLSLILLTGLAAGIGYALSKMGGALVAVEAGPNILTPFLCLFFITPAKIFFGEDFANRTINNSIIKAKGRWGLFAYRSLATIVMCLLYVLLGLFVVFATYHLLTGTLLYEHIWSIFVRQSLFYVATASLAILVFNIFSKMYQSNTLYILLVMVAEDFINLVFSTILKSDLHQPFMIFQHLRTTIQTVASTEQLLAGAFQITLFLGLGCWLFSRRELK